MADAGITVSFGRCLVQVQKKMTGTAKSADHFIVEIILAANAVISWPTAYSESVASELAS